MGSKHAKNRPLQEASALDAKLKRADPLIKHAITEYRNEISRLKRQLVKEQIAHETEKNGLLAQLEEAKRPVLNIHVPSVPSGNKAF